jgi:hypothetical protein
VRAVVPGKRGKWLLSGNPTGEMRRYRLCRPLQQQQKKT